MGILIPSVITTVVSNFLTVAGATTLTRAGSTATSTDEAGDVIEFVVPAGTPAAGVGGLSKTEIAHVWDLGASPPYCSVNPVLTWVDGTPDNTHMCVAVFKAASPPTSLADIEAANPHWLQVRTPTGSRASTYLKTGAAALATANNENKLNSQHVSYSVSQDDEGWGGALMRHRFNDTGDKQVRNLPTTFTGAGNLYIVLLLGLIGSPGAEQTTRMKLRLGGHAPV
jgi:hypothetical protein